MNEDFFRVRAYSKAELAALYNPNECITVSLQILSRWIRKNPTLMKELAEINYNKFRRGFTPKEVELIVKHLGTP